MSTEAHNLLVEIFGVALKSKTSGPEEMHMLYKTDTFYP